MVPSVPPTFLELYGTTIYLIVCGAIAYFLLMPLLESQWDINNPDEENYFIYAYAGYGLFCLAFYFFVIMPWLDLPALDMS